MPATPSTLDRPVLADLARRGVQLMVDGTMADFEALIHPDAVNHEAVSEPPEARIPGPAGFEATARWLRAMFADLAFGIHEVVVDGDLVAVHNTMSGRQVGEAVFYDADGRVDRAMPATGKPFVTTQSHWLRFREGMVVEHWANRDDLGLAVQLGWVPPKPLYLWRSARATRRARAAQRAGR